MRLCVQEITDLLLTTIIGPKTIAAINNSWIKEGCDLSEMEDTFIQRLCLAQEDRYLELILKNPKLAIYQRGWLARAEKTYFDLVFKAWESMDDEGRF